MRYFYLLIIITSFFINELNAVPKKRQKQVSESVAKEEQEFLDEGSVDEKELLNKKNATPHNWNSNVDVARKIIQSFENLQSYSAQFKINVKEGNRSRQLNGSVFYQKPNKMRYEFAQPKGNLIVSDGKIMWFYVQRLNTVGKQELDLKKKKASGQPIFRTIPLTGVRHLFRKYHYRFDRPEQPRLEFGQKVFVLDLEQREKIGGYENIKLYVDSKDFLILKAVGDDGYGKVSTIEYSKIELNPSLEGKLFQFQPSNNLSVVQNPLVSE